MSLHTSTIIYKAEAFKHYYLCRYLPITFGKDGLSRSIIQFKNGNSLAVKAWTECAVSELMKAHIQHHCFIVRVLTSGEQKIIPPGNTSLDYLGRNWQKF